MTYSMSLPLSRFVQTQRADFLYDPLPTIFSESMLIDAFFSSEHCNAVIGIFLPLTPLFNSHSFFNPQTERTIAKLCKIRCP